MIVLRRGACDETAAASDLLITDGCTANHWRGTRFAYWRLSSEQVAWLDRRVSWARLSDASGGVYATRATIASTVSFIRSVRERRIVKTVHG